MERCCGVEVSEEWLAGGKIVWGGRAVVDRRWWMGVGLGLRGGSVCEGRGGARSVGVVGRGWVCWIGSVCELIFVFAEGIEASSEGETEDVVLDCMGEGIGCVGVCVNVMDLEIRWDT